MKTFAFIFYFIGLVIFNTILSQGFHSLKALDIEGNEVDFSSFKGKKVLIVNTASKCGFTPQYKELETLYQTYKDKGLVVIGFPSNDFFKQEPGSDSEIKDFCKKNYGVSFKMMSKVSVKGNDICSVYQFLTQKSKNGVEDSDVKWNFQKYLINEKGILVKVVSHRTSPLNEDILDWVKSK
jgi:glutathione peroxidase